MHPLTLVHTDAEATDVGHAAYDVVPLQLGPGPNVLVAAGTRVSADLQQILPVQSLLWSQYWIAQVAEQTPSQQIGFAVPAQSVDCVQSCGQLW